MSFSFTHTDTSGVSNTALQTHTKTLSGYRDKIKRLVDTDDFQEPESALRLPDASAYISKWREKLTAIENEIDPQVVIVVGMGGSSRGAKAIYDTIKSDLSRHMLFVDTIAANKISNTVQMTKRLAQKVENVVVCTVSKSGTTPETLANTTLITEALTDAFAGGEPYQIAITDAGSPLEKSGEADTVFHIPDQVGGRFSVLSTCGVVPLGLAGVNVDALLDGASDMRDACLSGRPTSDPAAALAAILFEHAKDGRRILNQYFFNRDAASYGEWSTQLFAESLGKRMNRQGNQIFSGLYPTTSFAPDDLHALFQLQLGGPKNFFTIFIREIDTGRGDLAHEITGNELTIAAHVDDHTLGGLEVGLAQAVQKSFKDADRPFVEISVPSFTPYRLGQLMMLQELTVMYVADLLEVNAFDQPEIQNYKDTLHAYLQG